MSYKDCIVTTIEYTAAGDDEFSDISVKQEVYDAEGNSKVSDALNVTPGGIPVTTNLGGYDSEGNIKFTDDSEIVLWSGILAMKDILGAKVEGFPVGYLLLDGVKTRVVIQEPGGTEPRTISLEYPGSIITWEISQGVLEDILKALIFGPTWAFFS